MFGSSDNLKKAKQQISRLENELAEEDLLRQKMTGILHRTSNALHGKPHPSGFWSWHDLPERAQKLREELAATQREREKARRRLDAFDAAVKRGGTRGDW